MNFKTERLEELCELVIDCPHSTPKWTDSGFIVLRNQNIRNGILDLSTPSFTDETDYRARVKRARPQTEDIVFTREAPMGEVCLIPEGLQCCLGQRQVLLRANKKINPHYLFWALQSPYVRHQISWNEGTGTTVSNVRIPVIKDLKIPRLGAIENHIADVMNSVSMKSLTNLKINQTLEQMAQALFKSWFVDFEPVRAKITAMEAGGTLEDATLAAMTAISGKDTAALAVFAREQPEKYAELKATAELFPASMQESALGAIPQGWLVQRIGSLIELVYGKALKSTNRKEGNVPVYGSGGITGFHNEPLVPHGSIIVGRKGTVGSLYWEDSPFFAIDTTYYVRPLTLPLTYCYYAMQTLGLEKLNTDAAVPGLNRENVYRLELVRPSLCILSKFDTEVSLLRKTINANSDSSKTLANLRDTLLPRLLSGEITLPEADPQEA